MDQSDLQTVLGRRAKGESWQTIADSLKVPESTLRGRLEAAGLIAYNHNAKGKGKAAISSTQNVQKPAAADAVAKAAVAVAKTFVPPAWYPALRYAMVSEKGATLFGPRGCGKSTAIRQLADELGRPTITLQCAANMQIDSLLGTWTSQSGTLSFVDGALTLAVRSGSWLLAEESNVIHPGVWSLVNTLTDQTGEGLRLPSGEVVPQNPDFRLVLIYNEGYAGTREVNAALKDRLMPIYCGYLPADQEVELLAGLTGIDKEQAKRVQEVAAMIRAANLRFDLSPRSLVRWIKLVRDAGLNWADAYERAIVDLAGPPELAAPQRACLAEIARNTVAQWEVK